MTIADRIKMVEEAKDVSIPTTLSVDSFINILDEEIIKKIQSGDFYIEVFEEIDHYFDRMTGIYVKPEIPFGDFFIDLYKTKLWVTDELKKFISDKLDRVWGYNPDSYDVDNDDGPSTEVIDMEFNRLSGKIIFTISLKIY